MLQGEPAENQAKNLNYKASACLWRENARDDCDATLCVLTIRLSVRFDTQA